MKKIISIFITLSVVAVAAVFMFNKPLSAEDKLMRENIEALADDPNDSDLSVVNL